MSTVLVTVPIFVLAKVWHHTAWHCIRCPVALSGQAYFFSCGLGGGLFQEVDILYCLILPFSILLLSMCCQLTSALPAWTAPPWCCSSPCRWRPRHRSRCSQVQNCCKARCPGPPLHFTFIHDTSFFYPERGWNSVKGTCLPMSAPYTVTGLPSWALTLVQCSEMFIITWWGEEI